jgi:phosphoribosylaminoimidazole-succinocarboxamide synthase
VIRHPFLDGRAPPPPPVARVDLPGVPLLARGKVREMYDLGDQLLMVASDRLSAFDVVLDEPIPGKGIVLSTLSAFWFEQLGREVPNHFVSDDPDDWPEEVRRHAELLRGRAMLVRRCRRINVECVVRGYLAGSGWAEYRRQRTLAGVPLPLGLIEADKLPEPVFTPTTKADQGHDEPLSVDEMADLVGRELTDALQERSLKLYTLAERHARARGLILADTKFEFGLLDGQIVQIDESLTPDSSRFWPADQYEPGSTPPSFDKQPVRDYLETTGWDKRPPPPPLPPAVIRDTTERYREAFRLLAGSTR